MNEFCFLIALMTVVVQESVSGGKPEVKIGRGGGGAGSPSEHISKSKEANRPMSNIIF